MKWMMIAVLAVAGSSALAQLSPEEAKAKLDERNAKRLAERSQVVQVTVGELADLRAKVAQLEAEVRLLRSQAGPKPVVKKPPEAIEVGMTKEEVLAFIKSHNKLQIISLSASAGVTRTGKTSSIEVTGKREQMVIARYEKHTEESGTQRNTLGGTAPTYSTVESEEGRITVILFDGVVTGVDAG